MASRIPDGIDAEHILRAMHLIAEGTPHAFAESTGYDVVHEGKRYPPKAVIGVAAEVLTSIALDPYSFKGGLGSKCFRVLTQNGFTVIAKGESDAFPDEINEPHTEGLSRTVEVNRYERDPRARRECIRHYGPVCQVCGIDFAKAYGVIGDGFIHVHHLVPLASIGMQYIVKPITDLRPVCPNCHAMLHRKSPPFTIDELKVQFRRES